jgi:hypothetical protein
MSCCGDRRRALAQSYASAMPAQKPAVATTPSASAGALAAHAPILLRYLGRGEIVTRGPVTNKPYAFSATHPVQPVEASDAPLMLRESKYRRA